LEKQFRVKGDEEGQRLDRWLMSKLPQQSRKQIKSQLDAGCVLVNNRRVVIASWELIEGDEVEVRRQVGPRAPSAEEERGSPGPRQAEPQPRRRHVHAGSAGISASIDKHMARRKDRKKRAHRKPERDGPRVKIYHQDRDIIVVEKPGGLLSVPKDGKDARDSLLERIKAFMRRKYRKGKSSFISPLHRLDAETSGIMIFALSKGGQKLTSQFRNHTIHRTYQAIVMGSIGSENGVIDRPLEKGEFGGGRKAEEAKDGSGKRAVTEYRTKEIYKEATLLDVTVRTGRTHQIRVHLAAEGNPIMGDSVYDSEFGRRYPEIMDEVDRTLGFRRHALHASAIGFKHPTSGKKMTFRSSLPDDMKSLIDWLRENC